MHRTYSMRASRAPTASQIQNPPPPSSSTKSGRFFGKANIGTSCDPDLLLSNAESAMSYNLYTTAKNVRNNMAL